MLVRYLAIVAAFVLSCYQARNATVFVPSEYTYLLPPLYQGGNESTQFLASAIKGNDTLDALITLALRAPFIVFDREFYSIFGHNPELVLAATKNVSAFYEAGVWDPRRNHVWFAGSVEFEDYYLYVVDLDTFSVTTPAINYPIAIPNGGYYFDDAVYIVDFVCDDVTFVKRNCQTYMFFTDPSFGPAVNLTPSAVLPNAVWRYHAATQDLQAVISRGDILNPNGIAVSADMKKLYVTDTSVELVDPSYGQGALSSGATAIYVFDLDHEVSPVNKRLFAYARSGIPDGLHVDDEGRVWTGEGDGIVIRSPAGKVLGLINAAAIGEKAITNFALAGNVLAIGGYENLLLVNLAKTILKPERFYF